MKIPLLDLSRQYKYLQREIKSTVLDTFKRGDFVLGENVKRFEKEFADYCGVKYCVGVASGTDAILLSLRALGVGPGDEVITTDFTFIGTILPIIYLGAKPVLVDIDPNTYQIDVKKIEEVITPKTKAIIPVHLFGLPAPILEIKRIAKKHGLYLVEDACQAHGSSIKGKKCGSFGDTGSFSFYPTKALGAVGDAGVIVTNNKRLANNIRAMRNVGQFQKYNHEMIGYNSRLDTLQAGILLVKLKYLEEWTTQRRKLANLYDNLLSSTSVILPPFPKNGIQPNYYVYVIRSRYRDSLFEFLKANNIDCAIYYPIPVHLQKSLKYLEYKRGDFPIAEKLAKEVLSLPIYPELKVNEVEYVCSKVKEFYINK